MKGDAVGFRVWKSMGAAGAGALRSQQGSTGGEKHLSHPMSLQAPGLSVQRHRDRDQLFFIMVIE